MGIGLSLGDVVFVGISLSPVGAGSRNFGNLLVLGDSDVIDVVERMRLYTSITDISTDFGSSAPEFLAAQLYFAQSPTPAQCYLGRWARTATKGTLRGGVLSASQQALANFTAVVSGGVNFTIDGVAKNLSALNFSAQTNLNGVASVVQTALGGGITFTWDARNGRFVLKSSTTGVSSTVTFGVAGTGTDVSGLLKVRSTDGGYIAQGIAAETLVASVTVQTTLNDWYGLVVASSVTPANSDYTAAADFIEASSISHIFGVTSQDAGALNSGGTSDLPYLLQQANYKRTFSQYSGSSPHAAASIFGRNFTVDFGGNNTTITTKFKQEPLITAETLTESQAASLQQKNCNVFVKYNNDIAFIQEGEMCNGFFFDEVHGTDWLQSDIQTAVFNLFFTSTTKIPQTDAGVNQILTVITARLDQAVTNGLLAPGVWTGPPFGALKTGDTLSKGYYVFAAPVASQSDADRQARKSPVITIAAKLAGAVHMANILVNVNR